MFSGQFFYELSVSRQHGIICHEICYVHQFEARPEAEVAFNCTSPPCLHKTAPDCLTQLYSNLINIAIKMNGTITLTSEEVTSFRIPFYATPPNGFPAMLKIIFRNPGSPACPE